MTYVLFSKQIVISRKPSETLYSIPDVKAIFRKPLKHYTQFQTIFFVACLDRYFLNFSILSVERKSKNAVYRASSNRIHTTGFNCYKQFSINQDISKRHMKALVNECTSSESIETASCCL